MAAGTRQVNSRCTGRSSSSPTVVGTVAVTVDLPDPTLLPGMIGFGATGFGVICAGAIRSGLIGSGVIASKMISPGTVGPQSNFEVFVVV
jgi:hypothetical protein